MTAATGIYSRRSSGAPEDCRVPDLPVVHKHVLYLEATRSIAGKG
ncbi:MAG: hypothetical protein NTV10_03560 [Methanoregula sp.]|nr:hypothetical protein [Methanoregula sp.]